jgi:uncharacterized membrane protein YcaP (DUF421 family)
MQVIVRAAILYLFLVVVIRLIGRKSLAELGSFELVLLIVMGDLIQQGVTQQDYSVIGAMLAVATFTLLTIALSYITFRWRRVRPALEGAPVVVVMRGRPVEGVLRRIRVSTDDLKVAAREQGIADLRQIDLGVMEADGKFSFMRRDEAPPHEQEEAKH